VPSAAGALQLEPAAQQLDPAAQQVADGVQQVAAGVQHADAALQVEAEQLDCPQLLPQLFPQLLPQLFPQLLPQLLPQLDRQQRDLPHFDAQQLRAKTSALVKTRPATVISALVTFRNV
jgi:X-X-X-Leu-X-X-Gly heptad repeat protein